MHKVLMIYTVDFVLYNSFQVYRGAKDCADSISCLGWTEVSETFLRGILYVTMMSVYLPDEGEVYTTGSNDVGQLGAKGRESQVSPVRVAALDTHTIIHIACGLAHTVAVTG